MLPMLVIAIGSAFSVNTLVRPNSISPQRTPLSNGLELPSGVTASWQNGAPPPLACSGTVWIGFTGSELVTSRVALS
jgi:hypothetical protein